MTGIDRAEFSAAVFDVVRRIPYGSVATYGDVAALAGRPRAARGVGRALRLLPAGSDVPWWRVVASGGRIALPHIAGDLQRMLLREEGVFVRGGKVAGFRDRHWRP